MKQWGTLSVLLAVLLLATVSTGLAQNFEIPITVTDGANTQTVYMGILSAADICINPADCFGTRCEQGLPPPPPAGVFDARFIAPLGRPAACYDQGSLIDYRPFASSAQLDTFRVRQQYGAGTTMTFSWPAGLSAYFTAMTLRFFDGSGNVNINMLTNTTADVTLAGDGIPINIFTTGPQPPPNPGPCFSALPNPVNFGGIGAGSSSTINLTVSNSGNANPLNISSIVSSNPLFTFLPAAPVVIPPSGSQVFQVTFSPPGSHPGGAESGNLTFTHDPLHPDCGAGATTSIVGLSGSVTLQGGDLLFSTGTVYRCDETDGNSETLKLVNYVGDPLKALQLKIFIPNTLLTNVAGVTRGSDIPAAQWNFSYQTYYNPTNTEVRIVIFGNGSNALAPGTYNDLVRFQYSTLNITGASSVPVLLSLAGVLGSTPTGTNAGVVGGPDQTVNVVNRTQAGDVNGDDQLDILDMLMIVDHILGTITLTPTQFDAADIAPWPGGDGFVDVLDLALLQDIILNGSYPSSIPCELGSPRPGMPVVSKGNNAVSKLTPGMDVKLTFHITEQGVAVRLENIVPVKGLQLEFGSLPMADPSTSVDATTYWGPAEARLINEMLRVLMYNQAGEALPPGDRIVGNIPFAIGNPGAVTVDHFVVAGHNNTRLDKVEWEISNETAPDLQPTAYMLHQNYPNPFNPSTKIRFSVPEPSDVRITIYNLLGQEVRTLFAGLVNRGTEQVIWDARDNSGVQVPSGMYIYRMTAGTYMQSYKMMFLK